MISCSLPLSSTIAQRLRSTSVWAARELMLLRAERRWVWRDPGGRGWLVSSGLTSGGDGVQGPGGTVYVVYDYHRKTDKQILMAAFTEQDVEAGRDVSGAMRLRVLVNQATGKSPQ